MDELERLNYIRNFNWNGNPRFRSYFNDKFIIEIYSKLDTFDKYNFSGKSVRASKDETAACKKIIERMKEEDK